MGHDVNIHESVYRLHDSMIELAKISRLLMAVDSGTIHQFKGMSLNNINLEGLTSTCFIFSFYVDVLMRPFKSNCNFQYGTCLKSIVDFMITIIMAAETCKTEVILIANSILEVTCMRGFDYIFVSVNLCKPSHFLLLAKLLYNALD
jgi:hypothetical protein